MTNNPNKNSERTAMDERVDRLWSGGKLLLGPMVRASSLPLRLAALEYGADVVYSEEIPAHRAAHPTCIRVVNPVLGTVDFIERKTSSNTPLVLFRTQIELECEPQRCVLQLGVSDAVTALKAARLFERDVAAIDINMGCAKHYSVSRGMGSALMTKPAVAEDIIKTLRRNLSIPISVKTRLRSTTCGDMLCSDQSAGSGVTVGEVQHKVDSTATMEWVQRLQSAGAQVVTLHMRTPVEKNRDAAHHEMFAMFHQALRRTNTPLVYNGDVWDRDSILKVHNAVGSTNRTENFAFPVMVCRAGLWNPSIFAQMKALHASTTSMDTAIPVGDLLKCIMRHSAATANCPLNTRYLLQQILAGAKQLSSPTRSEVLNHFTLMNLAKGLECSDYVAGEHNRQSLEWEQTILQHGMFAPPAPANETQGNIVRDSHSHTTDGTLATDTPQAVDMQTSTSNIYGAPAANTSTDTDVWSKFFNAHDWPGITSKTSHEYNDRYFDDNYYVAFSKPAPQSVKRPFSYAGFAVSSSMIVRTKKPAV